MRKFYRIIIEDEALKEELFNDKFDKKHNVNHLTAYSKLPPTRKKKIRKIRNEQGNYSTKNCAKKQYCFPQRSMYYPKIRMKQTIFVSTEFPVYYKFFRYATNSFKQNYDQKLSHAVNRADNPVMHTFICSERFWDVDGKDAKSETVMVQLYSYIDIFLRISEFRQGSTGFCNSLELRSVVVLQFRNINIEREKSPICQATLPIYYGGNYSNSQGPHNSNNLPFVIKSLYFPMMLSFAITIKPLQQ